jgi:hypothetical protein
MINITSVSNDKEATSRRLTGIRRSGIRRTDDTLSKPTPYRGHAMMPTKSDEENEVVSIFDFSSWIQALGFVFHNSVEKPVDKPVDNLRKRTFVKMLHQIA